MYACFAASAASPAPTHPSIKEAAFGRPWLWLWLWLWFWLWLWLLLDRWPIDQVTNLTG